MKQTALKVLTAAFAFVCLAYLTYAGTYLIRSGYRCISDRQDWPAEEAVAIDPKPQPADPEPLPEEPVTALVMGDDHLESRLFSRGNVDRPGKGTGSFRVSGVRDKHVRPAFKG